VRTGLGEVATASKTGAAARVGLQLVKKQANGKRRKGATAFFTDTGPQRVSKSNPFQQRQYQPTHGEKIAGAWGKKTAPAPRKLDALGQNRRQGQPWQALECWQRLERPEEAMLGRVSEKLKRRGFTVLVLIWASRGKNIY